MASKDYDDLLESFFSNSQQVYNEDRNKEEKSMSGENKMAKSNYRSKKLSKKSHKTWVSITSLVVAIIAFLVPYIFVDFTMDFEASPETYLLLQNGATIKNSTAEVYYVVRVPCEDSKKSVEFIYSTYLSQFSPSEKVYKFDVGEAIRKQAFLEVMTYLYYDTSNPYVYPNVDVYIKLTYELPFIHIIDFHKWYKITDAETKYVNAFSSYKIDRLMKTQGAVKESEFFEYYIALRQIINPDFADDELIEQTPKENISDLINWINYYRVKPISDKERKRLRQLYNEAIYGKK